MARLNGTGNFLTVEDDELKATEYLITHDVERQATSYRMSKTIKRLKRSLALQDKKYRLALEVLRIRRHRMIEPSWEGSGERMELDKVIHLLEMFQGKSSEEIGDFEKFVLGEKGDYKG